MPESDAAIVTAHGRAGFAAARALFEEYAAQFGIDLRFQGFEAELSSLPAMYGPPAGRLLLARCGGRFAGCVGVRALSGGDCEMKRLYVRADARGHGLGRDAAANRLLEQAYQLGRGQDGQQCDTDACCSLSKFTPGGALEYHALTKPKKCEDNPSNTDISLTRSSLWNLA